jgi:hypothetical protein
MTTELYPIECDVCSQTIPSQPELMSHMQLHLLQFNRLFSRALAHNATKSSDNVETCAPNIESSPDESDSTEHQSPTYLPKHWKCPDVTCDHGAFRRRTELIRHYAIHHRRDRTCHCRITFHQTSKFLYHKCTAGHSSKKRWELVRPEVQRALDEASENCLANSPRRGIRRKLPKRPLPGPRAEASVNHAPISPFTVPNDSHMPVGIENLRPPISDSVMGSFSQPQPTDPPLLWNFWGSEDRHESYPHVLWDSSQGQGEEVFCST